MADKTKIEWTDASWTPIRARNLATGRIGWHCEHATTGCEFCYAENMNKRLGTELPFKPGHRRDIEIFLDEKMLTVPLRWKKPRMIFVCSMSDLFADFVKDEWIDRMLAVMALCPQHTFQVLTKRAERMRDYLIANRALQINGHIWSLLGTPRGSKIEHGGGWQISLPLPNVWLGVSCERQQEADERIPLLQQTPATIRFISAESLLGPIDLNSEGICRANMRYGPLPSNLDWVIVGGESGRHARPMQVEWARDIVEQCKTAKVPCFVKQLGDAALSDGYPLHLRKAKGGDINEWPLVVRVREQPIHSNHHAWDFR